MIIKLNVPSRGETAEMTMREFGISVNRNYLNGWCLRYLLRKEDVFVRFGLEKVSKKVEDEDLLVRMVGMVEGKCWRVDTINSRFTNSIRSSQKSFPSSNFIVVLVHSCFNAYIHMINCTLYI